MEDCEVTDKMFPQQYAYEMYRMKRYEPNGVDEFHDHVDVGNQSLQNGSWYFFISNEPQVVKQISPKRVSVSPKTGRLLMFPPMWTHLHAGRKVTGDVPKYILEVTSLLSIGEIL